MPGYIKRISSFKSVSRLGLERLADLSKAPHHVSGRAREDARSCHWLSPPLLGTSRPRRCPLRPGSLGPHPGAVPRGLPVEGAPSAVSGLRVRLQPAPGTGPAAPPSRLLRGSAGRRTPTAQGAEPSRQQRGRPRSPCLPRLHARRRAASRRE